MPLFDLKTKQEKHDFVRELSLGLAREIHKRIDDGTIPPEWDGHELRAALAKLACRATSGLIPVEAAVKNRRSVRVRDFLGNTLGWS